MTDIANVSIPENMNVDGIIFKENYTQLRDDFGNGYIQFDTNGKIERADYLNTEYGNPPTNIKLYEENIKNYTGITQLNGFTIIAINGQLVFGFGCAYSFATSMFLSHYNFTNYWENKHDHFASVTEETVPYFKSALDHYIRGVTKPLNQDIRFEDLIDVENPHFNELNGWMSRDNWMEYIGCVREFYHLGSISNDNYNMENESKNNFVKIRSLPLC